MLRTILLLALLCVVVFAMPSDLREIANNNSTKIVNLKTCTVTEYVLALQHLCSFESIHGLWPDPEASCTTCTTEVFSESKLSSSTLAGMKQYWPTCQSGTNDDFWSHEWSKYVFVSHFIWIIPKLTVFTSWHLDTEHARVWPKMLISRRVCHCLALMVRNARQIAICASLRPSPTKESVKHWVE